MNEGSNRERINRIAEHLIKYVVKSRRLRYILATSIVVGTFMRLFSFTDTSTTDGNNSAEVLVEQHSTITISYDYDEIFNSSGTHNSYQDRRLFEFNSFGNYTSPDVRINGCRLTVVIVDPRPPAQSYNHPIWYTLESVATYVPYACVVFNTASCRVINQNYNDASKLPTNQQEVTVVAKVIYERALPLFRRMMENGQVRINILNLKKYGLHNCDNFETGSSIFMNLHFWTDEFIDGVDGDMILTVQDDSVLCRHFDIDLWKHFVYVGAPWGDWLNCDSFRTTWHDQWAPQCNGLTDYQLHDSMSHFCTEGYGGLQGNGGFSIRNRSWMVEAIQRCPLHGRGLIEDLYFSHVLNGLNASMPSSFEASLFSVEAVFPDQTAEYSNFDASKIAETINRLWGNATGLLLYEKMHRPETYFENSSAALESVPELYTIPIGFHKPWAFHQKEIFHGVQFQKECKFLKFLFD